MIWYNFGIVPKTFTYFYCTILSFNNPDKNNGFENIVGEEKMLVTSILSFSHNVFCCLKGKKITFRITLTLVVYYFCLSVSDRYLIVVFLHPKGHFMLYPWSSVRPSISNFCVRNSSYSFHQNYLNLSQLTINLHDV